MDRNKLLVGVTGLAVGVIGSVGVAALTPLDSTLLKANDELKTKYAAALEELANVKDRVVTRIKEVTDPKLTQQIKGLEESIAAFRADRQNLIDKISQVERELAIEKAKPPVIKEVTRIVTVDRIVPIVRIVTTTVPTIDVFGKYCKKHPTSIICK